MIRSYFPRNADCLPAFQPLCIRFFFFFFICPSVTTFLEQGNWYVVFFYFLFTRCNDHLFARDEDYRLSIIFDKIRYCIRIWKVWGGKKKIGWIIVAKNNVWKNVV